MPTVIIYWSPTRSESQKKRVIEHITQTLVQDGGAQPEEVLIIFQDILPGNVGRAGKMISSSPTYAHESGNDTGNHES